MDRSKLKPTSIATSTARKHQSDEVGNDSKTGGNVYSSVKLNKTSTTTIKASSSAFKVSSKDNSKSNDVVASNPFVAQASLKKTGYVAPKQTKKGSVSSPSSPIVGLKKKAFVSPVNKASENGVSLSPVGRLKKKTVGLLSPRQNNINPSTSTTITKSSSPFNNKKKKTTLTSKTPTTQLSNKTSTYTSPRATVKLKIGSSSIGTNKISSLGTSTTKSVSPPSRKVGSKPKAGDSKRNNNSDTFLQDSTSKTPKETYSTEKLNKTGKTKHISTRLDESNDDKTIIEDYSKLWLKGVLAKVPNSGDRGDVEAKVTEFVQRIHQADGLPKMLRRLSMRDNDIVTTMIRTMGNDPSITEIVIEGDERFKNLCPSMVTGFAESLRTNVNLKKLIITNVDLGNDFLSALADSIETNFNLEYVDLSNNCFTNDALVDFCLAMEMNQAIRIVKLNQQQSPIFTLREDLAVDALSKNEYIQEFSIEFQTTKRIKEVEKILERNKGLNKSSIDNYGTKLFDYLEKEATLAEKRYKQRKQEATAQEVQETDMPYLYELAALAQQYKLPYEADSSNNSSPKNNMNNTSSHFLPTAAGGGGDGGAKISMAKLNSNLLTADGSFLTEEFISQYLQHDETTKTVTFEFTNECKVFKRFASTDPARAFIVQKFVNALVSHPKANQITHLHMANSLIGNDFVTALCEKCLNNKDGNLLQKLHLINFETNYITGTGISAIAKCIADPKTWKYLQGIKLDNQKQLISSDAESDLANALCVNRAIIKVSLRVRTLYERKKINDFVVRNIDFLRQARRWYGLKTGSIKERQRNKFEILFDKIASDDPSITEVDLVSEQVFVSMSQEEISKAAQSFTNNTHVKKVKMSGLRLDDEFAITLGKALVKNTAIEKLDLESNSIGSDGILSIITAMKTNRTIMELLLRHQTKPLASTDEEQLPSLIEGNEAILKLSIDIRSIGARDSVDKIVRLNQEKKRKHAAKKPADGSGKRNRIQQVFDKIGANDPNITEVDIVSDQVFICLNQVEVEKAAKSFAHNTHVTKVKMSGLRLDDHFGLTLAESLKTNTTIETLDLERNFISTDGITAILDTLKTNRTLTELYLRYQSKPLSSSDEEKIPGYLTDNDSLVKLSLDIRSVGAKSSIDKKMCVNQEIKRRKNRK